MKIRRLEILGFKSFMERIKLRFDDGITGIVGPNGCGKSNIVDAIRWVMGEQSARVLRGKSMEDIIFAGSESKPSMGMAEVQITFENDGRNIPPEYASYSEVSVGRRLFRSGESEYSINRTPCRLLDVQDLFMGTGVGTKAYSIIGQGQIGLLVSQKPLDRRSLIEEAAGTSKYRARKKTAERKMEQTQQNLLRVKDVVAEIERNIGSLQRQARKAARFNKIRDAVREIELHSAAHRYLELQAFYRFLNGKRALLSARETELQALLGKTEASVEERRVQLLEEDHHISEIQEGLLSIDNQVRLNEQNVEFVTRELDSMSARGQEWVKEIDDLRAQAQVLTAEEGKAKRELDELVQLSDGAARRLMEREALYCVQEEKVNQLSGTIEQDRQEQLRLGEQIGGSRSQLSNLDHRLLELERRLKRLEAEREDLQRRIGEHHLKKEQQAGRLLQLRKLRIEFVARREAEENSLSELRSRAAENEARGLALREETNKKRSRLESLLEIERNFEGCRSGVRCVMQNARTGENGTQVLGLVADILQAPPRYETAVQAVLGDRLQSVVVRSQDAGLAAIDYLKTEAEGRSSFIPISLRHPTDSVDTSAVRGPGVIGPMHSVLAYDREYDPIVRYLLGDVVVVEDLSSALSVWSANGHRATLVTLEGDVLEPEGVLTGGSLEGPGTHLLANKREIRELQDWLQEREAELLLIQDRQSKLKVQLAAVGSSIDSLRQNSHDEEIRIVDQEKDLTHLSEDLLRLTRQLEDVGCEHQKCATEIEEGRREQELTRKLADEASTRQTEFENRIRAGRSLQEEEKRALAALGQETLELKIQAAASLERKESARRDLEHLNRSRNEIEGRIERLRNEISSGNVQSVQNKQKIDSSRREISDFLTRREQEQARLGRHRDSYERLLSEVREDEVKVKASRRENEEAVSDLGHTNVRIREIEMDLSHLVENIRRAYKIDVASCLGNYHLMPPPTPDALTRAEKLRGALERMGDVNPNAVEAYEELKQRHDFLAIQSQDLTDSLEKLERVIQKINRASRKRFREAFDAINEKFQEIFPRLFNGGRAHLALDDAQDVLEAGVDIAAQPPGKKLQNIELLSGGEKALTAVALLFSIFLVKPTPFCLLDEVDAPLDDVNIDRFNNMVKEMSVSSQFILITHNKRTMELLDRLYGITMEEPGISTVVSVRLTNEPGTHVEQAA